MKEMCLVEGINKLPKRLIQGNKFKFLIFIFERCQLMIFIGLFTSI